LAKIVFQVLNGLFDALVICCLLNRLIVHTWQYSFCNVQLPPGSCAI
jgi:hypothetical protein